VIYFARSAMIARGKTAAAMAFAHEIAAYVKGKAGIDVHVGSRVGGNPSQIGWFAQYDSMNALDKAQTMLAVDAKYMELIAKNGENFVPGSLEDQIWRML
jgi:hypothetical protein